MRTGSIMACITAAVLLVSCNKEGRELLYISQEEKIEAFVNTQLSSNPDARVVYNGSATRVVISGGEGMELSPRGRAGIYFVGYDFTRGSIGNSYIFATNNQDFATSAKWTLSDDSAYEVLYLDLTDKGLLEGLRDGLAGVREGEECYILFSGKHAFGKNKIGTIPANAPLAFRVWVQSVEN